jgi:hypothetical protein
MIRSSILMLGLGVGLGMGWLAAACGSGGVGGKQDGAAAEAPPVAAADARAGDEPAGAGADATARPGASDGKCGAAKNGCTAGSLVDVSDSPTSYLWRCLGKGGGADAACAAPIDDASTYFIAENGVDATAAAGSEAQPWATIEHALGRMKGGDLLFVKGGTYHEVFDIYGPSGTETSPTVVQAYPGQTPIFSGPGIDHQANSINATNHLILDGLTITNYQIGLDIGGDGAADHLLVRNLVIHDVGNHGLSVHYDSSYVTLEGNTVHDTGLYTQNGEGFYVGHGDSTPADNTHHVTIRNNLIFNTKDEAVELKIGTHDCVVENNTIHSVNKSGDSYGLGGGAIEVNEAVGSVQHYDANPNHLVRNNVVYDTPIAIRAGTGCLVYDNVIWAVTTAGIKVTNDAKDAYTRHIFHNTVDADVASAIPLEGGTAQILNNIGPASTNNLAMNGGYFIDAAGHDYHLRAGSAPIDAGVTGLGVDFDRDGVSRDPLPDIGACEWVP